jgi:hypothetical protein
MRETREYRETTLIELVTLVLKQEILERLESKDTIDLVDELAECRAREMVRQDRVVRYRSKVHAFTCEVAADKVYVVRHNSIDEAIRYALECIGNIQIVYDNNIVVFGGESDREIIWGLNNDDLMYRFNLNTTFESELKIESLV